MELSSILHIPSDQLIDFEADVFITTLGAESRSTTIARLLEQKGYRKIALAAIEHSRDFSFQKNSDYFLEQGYEIVPVETEGPNVSSIFEKGVSDELRIVIDCTNMSPQWYYEFFNWFSENQDNFKQVTIRVAYTMASFVDSESYGKVKSVEPFLQAEEAVANGKKTALILGLGHEEHTGDTIYKKINPDLLYLFYADPPVDKKFVEKVFVNNHTLINATPIRNLIAYPIRNGQHIYQILIDVILPLRNEYSILLVPQGPKFFSVVALMVHLIYPDIRISYPKFKKTAAIDRHPCDEPVVLDVHFEDEE